MKADLVALARAANCDELHQGAFMHCTPPSHTEAWYSNGGGFFIPEPSSYVSACWVGWGVDRQEAFHIFFSRHIPQSKSAFWDRTQVPGHHHHPPSSPFLFSLSYPTNSDQQRPPPSIPECGKALVSALPAVRFPSSPPFAAYRTPFSVSCHAQPG